MMVISYSEQELISDTIQAASLYAEKSSINPTMTQFIVIAIAIIALVLAAGFIQDVIRKKGNPSNVIILFFGVLSIIASLLCFAWLILNAQDTHMVAEAAYNEFIANYNTEYGVFAMPEEFIIELAEEFF